MSDGKLNFPRQDEWSPLVQMEMILDPLPGTDVRRVLRDAREIAKMKLAMRVLVKINGICITVAKLASGPKGRPFVIRSVEDMYMDWDTKLQAKRAKDIADGLYEPMKKRD